MSNILISICIPTFNRAQLLEGLLNKLVFLGSDRFVDCEVVVSDNGSSDETQEVCEKFSKESKYKFLYHRHNKNLGVARNIEGLYSLAKGEYFLFVGDDDEIFEDKLFEIMNILRSKQPKVIVSDEKSSSYVKGLRAGQFLRQYFYLFGNTYHGIVKRQEALNKIPIIEKNFKGLSTAVWPQTIIAALVACDQEGPEDIILTSCLVGSAPHHSTLNIKNFMYYARTLTSLYEAASLVTLISEKKSPLIFFYTYGLRFTLEQAYQMLVQRITESVTADDLRILLNNVDRSNVAFDFPLRLLVNSLRFRTLTLSIVYSLRLLKFSSFSKTKAYLSGIQNLKYQASKGSLNAGQRYKNYWDAE